MDTFKHNSIKAWHSDERPREKLMEKGAETLSEAELLGIILGSGYKNLSAVDLGRELIHAYGSLSALSKADIPDLLIQKGIGPAKAAQIIATFELGRRKNQNEHLPKRFSSSQSAGNYLCHRIGHLPQEAFYILCLDQGNQLVGEKQLFTGGVHATLIDPKVVFQFALKQKAVRIIVSHNHPSGNLTPSQSDRLITDKLRAGGDLLDIKLLDHIIVSEYGWYSFQEEEEKRLTPNIAA